MMEKIEIDIHVVHACLPPLPWILINFKYQQWRTILLLENEEYIKMYNSCVKKWKINTMNK